jgi:transcriptional regulator with XRE-family HTH domain
MMNVDLKAGRAKAGLTQAVAASRLHVSQPYLSQLESGKRAVTKALARRAASVFGLSATTLPLPGGAPTKHVDADKLRRQLAGLGYPGFTHLRQHAGQKANPATVMRDALVQRNLETRVSEALPWVAMTYPNLQWDWLVQQVKLNDTQNRLGFVVELAKHAAEKLQRSTDAERLSEVTGRLEQSKLAREDTLCRESMSTAEREWLAEHRSPEAKRWNLLSGLAPEQLAYA